jgi:hypothetical protein
MPTHIASSPMALGWGVGQICKMLVETLEPISLYLAGSKV